MVLPDDPDYARLWKLCDDENSGRYGAYQKLTTRPIPVVRLTPQVPGYERLSIDRGRESLEAGKTPVDRGDAAAARTVPWPAVRG